MKSKFFFAGSKKRAPLRIGRETRKRKEENWEGIFFINGKKCDEIIKKSNVKNIRLDNYM